MNDEEITELRDNAAEHRRKAEMYGEVAEVADYLDELDSVVCVEVADAGAQIYMTVHTKELSGTVGDMIADFSIFGNTRANGVYQITFEIKPSDFAE